MLGTEVLVFRCLAAKVLRRFLHLSIYHLFCLFLQFCEAYKQLAKAALVQSVQFSHIFKRDKLMLKKDPLH